jgi:hypothetical protein
MELPPPLTDAKPGPFLTPIPLFFACRLSVDMADDRALIFNSLGTRTSKPIVKYIENKCGISLEAKDLQVTTDHLPHTFTSIVP